MEKKLIVIDGNSLLFRAFYATYYGDPTNIMRTKDGTPTNAIFAFSNMLSKILQTMKEGESIFVGFDADSHTFRKEEFDQYKANRKPAPEELIPQFAMSRELLDAIGVVHYEEAGIEADDICGTIAKRASKLGYHVDVYTSDKDYLQLIDENITIRLIRKGLSDIDELTPTSMKEEFGFEPLQIIDYKGLRGDASDNLPGIPGIGEKTAVKLIGEYGSFDAIVEAAKNGLIKGKMGQNIIEGEELGRTCYRLATILIDAKLPFDVADLEYKGYSFNDVNAFCQKYELKQFLARLPSNFKRGEENALPEVDVLTSLPGFSSSRIGLALDFASHLYHDEEPLGIAISDGKKIAYLNQEDAKGSAELKALLENPGVAKCVYDAKACYIALRKWGIELQGVDFDLLLSAYLLDSSLTDSPELVYSSFGADVSSEEQSLNLFSQNRPTFTGKEAFYALTLRDKAIRAMKDNEAYDLFVNIEMPLSKVLAKMELEGFPLHKDDLLSIGEEFRIKRDALEKEIHDLAGYRFNVSSPKQVSELLFQKLLLADGKILGTSVEVLRSIESKHPIVSKILEYRKYAKLVSTYIDGLTPHIRKDGKIHTYFNQAQTTTGRLSSSNPNLQNISTRDEESKTIRKAFYYDDPNISIASFDYGQIELRILAALSHCQTYIDIFESDRDVHSETARRIFNIPEGEEVPHLARRRAKAVNFAIIYGVTPFGLADQIGGTPGEAVELITSFKQHYPEVDQYLQSVLTDVEQKGYVTTMFGRRRYLREITDPNYAKREAARRAALNAPVQGSAADLIKIAMLRIDEMLTKGGYKTKMVLQIHDELLFALDESEREELLPKIEKIMIECVKLPVRLTVESSVGRTWYEAKD
ncbi:MAG: DNA polymerase I [Erysipelotrichaceae bacterium]|nr:DNA polymerase I [Erysipelotrichaceae bacterium]